MWTIVSYIVYIFLQDFHYDSSERIILEDKEKEGDKQEGINLTALLEGPGGGSTRKKKNARASTKGGPPRMPHFRKKRKKKDPDRIKSKKADSAEDVVINGTTMLSQRESSQSPKKATRKSMKLKT
jgi:hypothetical protein